LVATVGVISVWIRHTRFEIQHFSPAWFIPVVGNLIVPVAGVEHAPADISWFFFAAGLVFGIVLFTILMYRLLFHSPLQERMLPTLFIVIAPPAVGAVSYFKLTGAFDSFARVLYFFAAFLLLLLVVHAAGFVRLKFFLSWWAYLFPIAALTIATTLLAKQTGSGFYEAVAAALWAGLTILMVIVAVRTLVAVRRREICVPE
jgi:tellurite resistance protein